MNKQAFGFVLILCGMFVNLPLLAQEDAGLENLRQTGKAFSSMFREVSPSVVFIQTERVRSVNPMQELPIPFDNDLFRRFFGDKFPGAPESPDAQPQQRRAIGQGSGFVFAAEGGAPAGKSYIMTNNHVVENADRILVQFDNGREYVARVTGRDPLSDVAVVEIDRGDLPALSLGDSNQLEVGEWVLAIGNPFGLNHTLTAGVVSAKGRNALGIKDYEDFIQTDAAINPGNSGGPLVNLNGKVVGMNTAIFSRSGGYMGVGFAIPINQARAIADQLITHGAVTRGFLGVVIQELTPELAKSFDIEAGQGILVAQVSEDSPAEKAGLQQGDIITRYQDLPVRNVGGFRNRVAMTEPGSKQQLTVIRDDQTHNLTVTIGKLEEQAAVPEQAPSQSLQTLGLAVQSLTPEIAQSLGIEETGGVVVTAVNPGSAAALSGITTGTVILKVNREAVENAEEFKRAVDQARSAGQVLLLVSQGGSQRFVVLRW